MKILEIKKYLIVLDAKQFSQIKGGVNNQSYSEIIIIDDIDTH